MPDPMRNQQSAAMTPYGPSQTSLQSTSPDGVGGVDALWYSDGNNVSRRWKWAVGDMPRRGGRMHGFFELKTPSDLLHKLEREYERWKADPLNVDHAWNFFVTAEHLLDWLGRRHNGPPLLGGESINKFRTDRPHLRICSHLANGGKHFRPNPKQHTSVASTRQRPGYVKPGYVKPGYGKSSTLMVDLTPDEQKALSLAELSIEALTLAADVLAFWQA